MVSDIARTIASNNCSFAVRTVSALNEFGGSIATIASNWNMWFGIMSRSAPVGS